MIALCAFHHDAANKGIYTNSELRELKLARHYTPASSFLPWSKTDIVHVFGSNAVIGGVCLLGEISNDNLVPLIGVNRNEDGLITLTLTLRDVAGTTLLQILDNDITIAPEIHDFSAAASSIRLSAWLKSRELGLDVSFRGISLERAVTELGERASSLFKVEYHSPWNEEFLLANPWIPEYARFPHTINFFKAFAPFVDRETNTLAIIDVNKLRTWHRGQLIKVSNNNFDMYGLHSTGGVFHNSTDVPFCLIALPS